MQFSADLASYEDKTEHSRPNNYVEKTRQQGLRGTQTSVSNE